MNFSAGIVSVFDRVDVGDDTVGEGGNGILTMSGTADLTAGELRLDATDGFTGVANLNGGSVHVDQVTIGANGTLYLAAAATLDTYTNMTIKANGLLVLEGDHTVTVDGQVLAGELSWSGGLVGYDDAKEFDAEYDTADGWLRYKFDGTNTEVWTVIPEPATLGLVGFVAGAMVFIRRRFMI